MKQIPNKLDDIYVNEIPAEILTAEQIDARAESVAENVVEENAIPFFDIGHPGPTTYTDIKAVMEAGGNLFAGYQSTSGKITLQSALAQRVTGETPSINIFLISDDGEFEKFNVSASGINQVYYSLPPKPINSGTFTLKAIDGALTWVADATE